jgi:hypothetical protein
VWLIQDQDLQLIISNVSISSPFYSDADIVYNRATRLLTVPQLFISFKMVLTISYSLPALTITGNSTSIKIGNYSFSETTNTVSALTMTDFTKRLKFKNSNI